MAGILQYTGEMYHWTHTHTHTHPFNGPFSGTTQVSRYQKGKTNLDFTEARDSEWQWLQLGHVQVCTSLQTDNHASTPPLSFLQAGCPSCRPTNSVKALKAKKIVHQCFRNVLLRSWCLQTIIIFYILQCSHISKQEVKQMMACNRVLSIVGFWQFTRSKRQASECCWLWVETLFRMPIKHLATNSPADIKLFNIA